MGSSRSATVLAALALAACHGQTASLDATAAAADAPLDATADAPPYAPITVFVAGYASDDPASWGPFAGWKVYVQDTATSPARIVTTGADGIATAYVAPGGFVTAEDPADRVSFETWGAVQPGDHLVLALPAPGTPVAITLPSDPGATYYSVQTSCGGGASSAPAGTVSLTACPAQIDVAVVTSDGSGYRKRLVARDVPFSGGPIDLSSRSYTAYTPIWRHLAISGGVVATAFDGSIAAAAHLPSGLRDRATLDPIFVNAKNGMLVADQSLLYALPGTDLRITTALDVNAADGTGHVLDLLTWKPGAQIDPVTIDVAPMQPPWIVSPTYDPATHTVAWTTSGSGPAADYALVRLVVARKTTTAVGWDVVGPVANDTIVLPIFPLGDDTTIEVNWAAAHTDTDGYDAARPRFLSPSIERTYVGATGYDASVSAYGIAGRTGVAP